MKLAEIAKFVPIAELNVIRRSTELTKVLEEMAAGIDRIPALYETDGIDADCALHYFNTAGAADWYVYELDANTQEAYGFVTLSGCLNDPYAEYGYIDLKELRQMPLINLDLHFGGLRKSDIKAARGYAAA